MRPHPLLRLYKIIALLVAMDFLIRQSGFHLYPYTNYSHCWKGIQANEELQKRIKPSSNQPKGPGSGQISKPVKERTKNENGVTVWLIFVSQFKLGRIMYVARKNSWRVHCSQLILEDFDASFKIFFGTMTELLLCGLKNDNPWRTQ